MGHVDGIHIVHQLQRLLFADMFVQRAAEVVGDIVFTVRKRACAAESAHDRAAFAVDTGFDLLAVDGTFALFEAVTRLEYRCLEARVQLLQLIGRENTARARPDNDNIVMFHL